MSIAVNVLNVALPFFYLATVGSYAHAFLADYSFAKKLKTALLAVTLVGHLIYIVLRTVLFAHPPITTIFEIMSIVAFSIAASYSLVEHRTGIKNTGFFILVLALVFQSGSSAFIQDLSEVQPVLRSNLLGLHVTSAMLGFSAFAIAAVYGTLYLMLYHNLKAGRFGIIYQRLPNLEKLESMATFANISGFGLLSLAIGIGLIWLSRAFDNVSYFDPKLIGTFFVWLVYGVGLTAKGVIGLQGRKIMILSIVGFLTSFFSLTIINFYFTGFHRFF
ncbi:MAG: cytochrome C biogenesis protein [Ignavibacteria bacterium]|nr:cytochrome C biogenesis protein [Ignavibacteria bacterium]